MSKTDLRAIMLARRKALAAASPDAGVHAAAAIDIQSLHPIGIVAAYHPMGAEVDCTPIAARFEHAGWQIAYPEHTHTKFEFHVSNNVVWPDLILAPLVAFDHQGHRLGRGGGWYDRAITQVRMVKPCRVIGVAYSGQQVDALPTEPHDVRLDGVLTETGYGVF